MEPAPLPTPTQQSVILSWASLLLYETAPLGFKEYKQLKSELKEDESTKVFIASVSGPSGQPAVITLIE